MPSRKEILEHVLEHGFIPYLGSNEKTIEAMEVFTLAEKKEILSLCKDKELNKYWRSK